MSSYYVVVVLWEDHYVFRDSELPKDPDEPLPPSLTAGILYKETERYLIIASHIERNDHFDNCDFTKILKASVLSTKKYGKIKIRKLRYKEGSS